MKFSGVAWPVAAWVAVLLIGGRTDAAEQVVAGEALVLAHPHINDSIGNPVYCLTFVDSATLATGAASGVLIWDVESGKLQHTLEVDKRGVDTIALDPHGKLLVAGGASGIIQVWDAHTFKPVRTLGPAPGAIRGLSISPDGRLLAAAGPNGQLGAADKDFGILLWELTTGRELPKIPHPAPDYGTTVLAFLPDGKRIVSAQDRILRVWEIASAKSIKTVEIPDLPRTFGSLALNGNRIVTGAFEPKLRLWNSATWNQALAWDAHDREPPPRRGTASVNFSPDGKWVLSGGMDGKVCIWDAASGLRLLELDARGESSGRWITGVAMSADGTRLAASHFGGNATVWRITKE